MQLLNDTVLDEKRFRAFFGQYFRFDVSEVQRFLAGLCVELTKEYREENDNKLYLTSLILSLF